MKKYNIEDSTTYFESDEFDIIDNFCDVVRSYKINNSKTKNEWFIRELCTWMSNSANPGIDSYCEMENIVVNNINNNKYIHEYIINYVSNLIDLYYSLYNGKTFIQESDINNVNIMEITERIIKDIKLDNEHESYNNQILSN